MTRSRRPPSRIPRSPWSHPGITAPTPIGTKNVWLRSQLASNSAPVSSRTPTYFTSIRSPAPTTSPDPGTTSLITRSDGSLAFTEIVIEGFSPPDETSAKSEIEESEDELCNWTVVVETGMSEFSVTESSLELPQPNSKRATPRTDEPKVRRIL